MVVKNQTSAICVYLWFWEMNVGVEHWVLEWPVRFGNSGFILWNKMDVCEGMTH
jgi:hypothetical protein